MTEQNVGTEGPESLGHGPGNAVSEDPALSPQAEPASTVGTGSMFGLGCGLFVLVVVLVAALVMFWPHLR